MNTQEFENISLDLLMGRLSQEERKKFLLGLTAQEKAEFSEKERMFNLVKKTGEVNATAPTDLVDRIMSEVRKEGLLKQKRGFMERSFLRKIAAPTALTVTVALALMTSNKMLTDDSLRPGAKVEAVAPLPQANEAYEDELKYISDDQKITQAAVREQAKQLDRLSKDQKASEEKLIGVMSEIVNRLEVEAEPGKKSDASAVAGASVPIPVTPPLKANTNSAVEGRRMDFERDESVASSSLEVKRKVADKEVVNTRSIAQPASVNQPAAVEGFGDSDLSVPADSVSPLGRVQSAAGASPMRESYALIAPAPKFLEGEKYGQAEERTPVLASNEPVSTFSIDVDTGGYSNLRKLIQGGNLPPSGSVRVEEMINYFDYNYPELDGPEPFSFSYEAAPSPFDSNKVFLKLGIKAKSTTPKTEQGWNLVFLVDVSGSMSDSDKLPLLKDSMKVFAEHMRTVDKLSIVTYAGNAGVLLEPTSGNQKDKIFNAINTLGAGGSTNGGGGIMAAYEQAEKSKIPGGVNRIILATDGDFNVGVASFDGLVKLIEEKRRSGVTLTTLGVGRGNYNEQNLEQLADKGNGNYFYLDSIDEASRVLGSKLTSNMEIVAKDVKLQIEFNPTQVASYRLIGYDNRKLNNEDFKNDAIDAGEIGAGHTVTAVYELVLAGSKAANSLQPDELRYQKVAPADRKTMAAPASDSNELAFLKIRYKAPQEDNSKLLEFPLAKERVQSDFSKTTDDFRFASAVAGFGQTLRASRYAGDISLDKVKEIASGAIGIDGDGKRKEFLGLVDQANALRLR